MYQKVLQNIKDLKNKYPFIETGSLGKSVLNRDIPYIRLGTGQKKVFYNGTHHSLEWITTEILLRFTGDYLLALSEEKSIKNHKLLNLFENTSLYIAPLVNPDGVEIVHRVEPSTNSDRTQCKHDSRNRKIYANSIKTSSPFAHNLIKWSKYNADLSQIWQANARGVDLNHNYDASWYLSRNYEKKYGINGPNYTRYAGLYPESEPETKAIVDFTRLHNFDLVLAFHSQGEVIYWDYLNMAPPEAKEIGIALSNSSGYSLEKAEGISSFGGYKDWYTKEFKKPGFTIEVGYGKNPLPFSMFDEIYNKILEMMLIAVII